MKKLSSIFALFVFCIYAYAGSTTTTTTTSNPLAGGTCHGRFPLPTDICWECMFPMTMFGNITVLSNGQEDTNTLPFMPVCTCNNVLGIPKVGIPISFWEPARMVDVVRQPWCFPTLGGLVLNVGMTDLWGGGPDAESPLGNNNAKHTANYNAHWYINPYEIIAAIISDNSCLENHGFDISYVSELDPAWNDNELEDMIEPDAFLFGNILAISACVADCVSTMTGFGSNLLFWCGGCNGSIYPMTGEVGPYVSGTAASSLVAQRTAARMHRLGMVWGTTGLSGLCGYYPEPLMDKTQYKYSMLYPSVQGLGDGQQYVNQGATIPNSPVNTLGTLQQQTTAAQGGGGTATPNGTTTTQFTSIAQSMLGELNQVVGPINNLINGSNLCCQPFGRTTEFLQIGKEVPVIGEDFGYMIYRKRDCCSFSAGVF